MANVLWGCLFVVFLGALATAFFVGHQATRAMQSLTDARADLATVQQQLQGAPDVPDASAAGAAASSLRHLDDAVAASHNAVWSAYERVPVLGPNLRTIRETAEALQPFARDGVVPLADAFNGTVRAGSTASSGSRAQLADRALSAVQRVHAEADAAGSRVGRIDIDGSLPQFSRPVVRLRADLLAVADTTRSWEAGASTLRNALGESGTRQYMLVIARKHRADQFILVDLAEGRVTARAVSRGELGAAAPRDISAFSTKRFPPVASALSRSWKSKHRLALAGVVLTDAGVLSDVVKATGSLRVGNGATLNARNETARFNASPAAFAKTDLPVLLRAVSAGRGEVTSLLAQLPSSAQGGAFRMWAADSRVERAVKAAHLDGLSPERP